MKFIIEDYRSIERAEVEVRPGEVVAITGGSDHGKCLGAGTLVLKADGCVVPVEFVDVGDELMGPDGLPRTVTQVTSGVGPLYAIIPTRGEPWVCNDAHVLSLVSGTTVRDISVKEWLIAPNNFKQLYKQFSVGVETFYNDLDEPCVDPYFLGVWFGDGAKTVNSLGLRSIHITKADPEIGELCRTTAAEYGLHVKTYHKKGCTTYCLFGEQRGPNTNNRLLINMRKLLGPRLEIPDVIVKGSGETRRQFLAGILDTDGYLSNNCFDFVQKRSDWARTVWRIARSLGLMAKMTSKFAADQNGTEGLYYRVGISGHTDLIPTRIPRKKATPRTSHRGANRTSISIEPIGDGAYYGFSLTGDGRFLLGDYTVTHNSNVLRAIRDLLYGARGTGIVMRGKPKTTITASISGDVHPWVRLEKGTKINRYLVYRDEDRGPPLEFSGHGSAVPPEVQRVISVREVEVDRGITIRPNYAGQDDPPFLISENGSVAAKVLGSVSGLHIVFAALREAQADATKHSRTAEAAEKTAEEAKGRFASAFKEGKRIAEAEEKVGPFVVALSAAEAMAEDATGLAVDLEHAITEAESSRKSRRDIPDVAGRLTDLDSAMIWARRASDKAAKLYACERVLERTREDRVTIRALEAERLSEKVKAGSALSESVVDALAYAARLRRDLDRLAGLRLVEDGAKKAWEETRVALANVDLCPLCQQPYKGGRLP